MDKSIAWCLFKLKYPMKLSLNVPLFKGFTNWRFKINNFSTRFLALKVLFTLMPKPNLSLDNINFTWQLWCRLPEHQIFLWPAEQYQICNTCKKGHSQSHHDAWIILTKNIRNSEYACFCHKRSYYIPPTCDAITLE